jgi:hypothetical protein
VEYSPIDGCPRSLIAKERDYGRGQSLGNHSKLADESREPAQLVIDQHGEPHEASDTMLIWCRVGPWKRIVATKACYLHKFPVPHMDSVESFIDYRVPVEKFAAIAQFDGSVMTERTTGEVSARCHDLEANSLALNLMHDIATGAKTPEEARNYYGQEVLDYRRKKPTPYMDGLRFTQDPRSAPGPDIRTLSDEDLRQAAEDGKNR